MQQERAGNAYLSRFASSLGMSSQSAVFAHAYAKGNTAVQPTLMDTMAKADSDITQLAAVDSRYGHALGSTESFSAIRTEWADVRDGSLKRSTADNDAAYGKLIATITN